MSKRPTISVIIPTYNRANLIGQCLDSVLAQRDPPEEIIVADDGSTDCTRDVVSSYGDRVAYFRQANSGPGGARNLGARHASGDYLALLDSDDVWLPWTTSIIRQVILSEPRPTMILLPLKAFSTLEELQDIDEKAVEYRSYGDFLQRASRGIFFGTCALVVQREALLQCGGFRLDIRNGEDLDIGLKLGVNAGFAEVRSPLCVGLRRHDQNITGNVELAYNGITTLLRDEVDGAFPGGAARRRDRRGFLAFQARPKSLQMLRGRRFDLAWSIYLKTLSWHLRQIRLRYLLGFPLLALAAWFGIDRSRRK